jgi:hypothetical protein
MAILSGWKCDERHGRCIIAKNVVNSIPEKRRPNVSFFEADTMSRIISAIGEEKWLGGSTAGATVVSLWPTRKSMRKILPSLKGYVVRDLQRLRLSVD